MEGLHLIFVWMCQLCLIAQPTGSGSGATRWVWRTAGNGIPHFPPHRFFQPKIKKPVCLLSLWRHIRTLFTWHSLSTSPFPLLLFVCAAQRAPLPWHLSAFFIGSFIMWLFPTLWVCRYNFPLYQWFYGWLWSLPHPEGLFLSESDCSLFLGEGVATSWRKWTGWKVESMV